VSIELLHTKTGGYQILFPEAVTFAEEQFSINWPPTEYPVKDDIHEVLTSFTEAEKHATISVLKLFTHYELKAGIDYWGGRVMRRYPSACIQRMATEFAHAELCMHGPFYNELNKALNLDTLEFYTSYINDPILKARMDFIDDLIRDKDDALSVAVFSLIEGAVLYSSFAFLKHFRANGKNKLKNLVSGINASVKDENIHSLAGAWLFSLELKFLGKTPIDYQDKVHEAALKIHEHEKAINAMLFEKGGIDGITQTQLDHFAESRIDLCLENLGMKKLFNVKYNPISEWFYDNINALKLHDFFNTSGSDYKRTWKLEGFLRNKG
jgi:ribonucleoside-diphosphate reductase beta chain